MDNSDTQEIKNKLDIVEVVREYIPQLKPAGSNWKGVCPFHNEKTPSFMVSNDKQIFHCFGCNEGGDVFTFVMKINGYEFPEALSLLAEKAGVTLHKRDPQLASVRNTLFDIHIIATELFHKKLMSKEGNDARKYLSARGISEKTIKDMKIGVAPDAWDKLTHALTLKEYSDIDKLASGLSIKSDKGKMYDRFRNRIILPFVDIQGRVVGFTGRSLEKKEKDESITAKYINSPQTDIYNKSEFMYGLYYAKTEIREKDEVIIVEGNFDQLSLFQAGYKNTVALSGTALTPLHIRTLKRFTNNIVFALDTDEAGIRALEKSILSALESEINAFVVDYKDSHAKDPDEVVQKDAALWGELVASKKVALAYLIEKHTSSITDDDVMMKKNALKNIVPYLVATKNAIEKEHFMKKTSEILKVSESAVLEAVRKVSIATYVPDVNTPTVEQKNLSDENSIVWQWLSLIIAYASLFKNFDYVDIRYISEKNALDVFIYIQSRIKKHETIKYSEIREACKVPENFDSLVLKSETAFKDFSEDEIRKEVLVLWSRVKKDYFHKKLQELSKRIHEAESGGETKKVETLIHEQQLLIEERTKENII